MSKLRDKNNVCQFKKTVYMLPQDWKDINNPTLYELRHTINTVYNELDRHRKLLYTIYLNEEENCVIINNIEKLEYLLSVLTEYYFEND